MARVHVTSEIGPLRTVLVHTPGRELVAVTPGNREDYLYDDIIDLELAEREHRRFVAVLERFAQVYEVRTLLTELVARPDVREFLVTPALEVVPSDALAKQLGPRGPRTPVRPRVGPSGRKGGRLSSPPEGAPRDSPGYDFHAPRPGGGVRLPPAFGGPGAPRRPAPPQEIQRCEGNAQLLRRHAGSGPPAGAGVLRRFRPLPSGAGAVVLSLQFLRRAARAHRPLRPPPGHTAGARASGLPHPLP